MTAAPRADGDTGPDSKGDTGTGPPATRLVDRNATLTTAVVALRRPGVRAAIGVQMLTGVLGAAVPSALLGNETGIGPAAGALWGAAGASWAAILTAAFVTCVLTADDAEGGTDLHLAGWSWWQRYVRGLLAALLLTGSGVATAAVLGAVTGVGDSLRTSGTVWAPVGDAPNTGWRLLLVAVLVAAVATAAGLSTGAATVAATGSLAAFLAGLLLTATTPSARAVVVRLPWGPAWEATADWPFVRLTVEPPTGGWLPVVLAWLAVGVVIVSSEARCVLERASGFHGGDHRGVRPPGWPAPRSPRRRRPRRSP